MEMKIILTHLLVNYLMVSKLTKSDNIVNLLDKTTLSPKDKILVDFTRRT